MGPWRPVEGKALGGRSKLLVFGWPFVLAVCVGVFTGWLGSNPGGSQTTDWKSLLVLACLALFPLALLGAISNTGIITFLVVRHHQRKRWVPPERAAAQISIAVLLGLAASVAGGAIALGLSCGACLISCQPRSSLY